MWVHTAGRPLNHRAGDLATHLDPHHDHCRHPSYSTVTIDSEEKHTTKHFYVYSAKYRPEM